MINAISMRGEFWMFCKEIHGITHSRKKGFLLSLCAEFVKPFSARACTVSDINYPSSRIHFMLLGGYKYTTIYGGVLYRQNLAQIAPCCRNRLFFTHHFWRMDGEALCLTPICSAWALRKRPPVTARECHGMLPNADLGQNGRKV